MQISKHGSDVLSDQFLYRSIVMALQYFTLTRLDIAFAANKACQFMTQPLDSHWSVVKRILCYLSGTTMFGLMLVPAAISQPFLLCAYNDSKWASDPDDQRLTSTSFLFFRSNLVS